MGVTSVRWSWVAVEPFVLARYREPNNGHEQAGVVAKACHALQVDRRAVYRWMAEGLTDRAADKVAAHLNLHPLTIWPGWLDGIDYDESDDLADLIRHGTHGALKWHRKNGKPIRGCEACSEFKAAYERAWREAHPDLERARVARQVAKLGTDGIAERDRRYRAKLAADEKRRRWRESKRRQRSKIVA